METKKYVDSELCIISADSRRELIEKITVVEGYLNLPGVTLLDIAYTLNSSIKGKRERLAIVSSSTEELKKKLEYASKKLRASDCTRIYEKSGVYYFEERLAEKGKIALLFPGEGSQYQNMLLDLCLHFPEVRRGFEIVDSACSLEDDFLPSRHIFPIESEDESELWKIEGAIESVQSANYGLMALVKQLRIKPDVIVGHSTGEFPALEAAGIIQFEDETAKIGFIRNGYAMMKGFSSLKEIPEGVLAAVGGLEWKEIESAIKKIPSPIFVAMENCFHQYVLCGSRDAIEKVVNILFEEGAICNILPFNRPYHTPWFNPALGPLKKFFDKLQIFPPEIEIYSCSTTTPYPSELAKIRSVAVEQWATPVKFQKTVEAMYEQGVRVFVEAGPRGNLTGFVDNILRDKTHIAVSLDKIYRPGIMQLNFALGLLIAHGVEMELGYLYKRRDTSLIDLQTTKVEEGKKQGITLSMELPRMKSGDEDSKYFHSPASSTKMVVAQDDASLSMKAYLQTMKEFITLQGEVMRAYFKKEDQKNNVDFKSHKFPLLGKIIEFMPGEGLTSIREFDVNEDIFLKDHTLGTRVSANQELYALPLIPFTVSMEILAEAAMAIFPKKVLTGMKDVRGYKWIIFEKEKVSLQITARRKISAEFEEIEVQIKDVSNLKDRDFQAPIFEGTVIVGDNYPAPQEAGTFVLKNEFRWEISGSEIYPKRLFHGPKFQAIDSTIRWGEDGFEGTLKVLSHVGLFRSNPNNEAIFPEFVIDPILLDALGSAPGVWAAKESFTGEILIPYFVKAIHFYGPNPSEGEKLKFQNRIISINKTQIVSDICLIREDGNIYIKIEGWEDRVFYITRPLHQFMLQSLENTLSSFWPLAEERLADKGKFKVCLLEGFPDDFFQRHYKIWEKMLAFLVFNAKERQEWLSMEANEKIRISYLLGRVAVKDAVRCYLKQYCGLELASPDVVIENDEKGKPFVAELPIGKDADIPEISISHTGMTAIAVAGKGSGENIGIDIESISNLNDRLLEEVFLEEEHKLAASIGTNPLDWMARFWCAKEAFSKAVGSGIIFDMKDIVVKRVDTEKVIMEVGGGWLKEFPFLEGKTIEAYTFSKEDLAIAICIL